MSAIPPLGLRKLRAEMILKNLDLGDVARLSGVGYAQCSQVLNGRLNHEEYFGKIRDAIKAAPMPKEAAAA
jgi:hypothetical protein